MGPACSSHPLGRAAQASKAGGSRPDSKGPRPGHWGRSAAAPPCPCPLAPRSLEALVPAGVFGLRVRGTLPRVQQATRGRPKTPSRSSGGQAGRGGLKPRQLAREVRWRERAAGLGALGGEAASTGHRGRRTAEGVPAPPPPPCSPRLQTKEPAGDGSGGGGDGARGRGAAVSRYRPQRPLTRAPPRSPPPARSCARLAPRQSARAPRPALGWVCARGQWAVRGGRAAGGAGAAPREPIAAVLLKLKILHYANRGGARARGGEGGTLAYKGAR